MSYLLAYLLLVNGITFATYGLDKRAAIKHKPRTPERTLHLLALLGGSPAALLAQKTFRHKTAKRSFRLTFGIIFALQLFCIGVLYFR